MESIGDSTVYIIKSEVGYLSYLYYLVSCKSYLKDENTEEPILAVQHLRKLVSTSYKDHPNKLTAIFPLIDSALPMVKRKHSQTVSSM